MPDVPANAERDLARRELARQMAATLVIAAARRDLTWAQIDARIGIKTGTSRRLVTFMEAGDATPSFEFLVDLFWACGVAFQWRLLAKAPSQSPQPQTIQIVPIPMPPTGTAGSLPAPSKA